MGHCRLDDAIIPFVSHQSLQPRLAGQEHFARLTRSVTRGTHGAFVVFDGTSTASLARAKVWKQSLDDQHILTPDDTPIPVILLANKVAAAWCTRL